MASTLAKPQSHHRQASRSNSASPSSVVTIKRSASLTSRQGTRPPVSGLRSQSPKNPVYISANLSNRTLSPDPTRRSSAVHSRPSSVGGFREGVGNLNRWSQSTASSKSSATHKRAGSFTRRLSGSLGPLGGFSTSQSSPERNVLPKVRPPPGLSPQRLRSLSPSAQIPPILPPIVTLASLTQAVDNADSPLTVGTNTPATSDLLSPSNYIVAGQDYFGEKWKPKSPSKQRSTVQRTTNTPSPVAISAFSTRAPHPVDYESSRNPAKPDSAVSSRSTSAAIRSNHRDPHQQSRTSHSRHLEGPIGGSGGTEGESSASSNRSNRDSEQRRKTPSQKAMLSKALQKAKHAVLLDNAQNYEGAMNAYGDACALLYQVMVRSSGYEDRKKLEAVRNTYMSRINELRNIDLGLSSNVDKALPDFPRDSRGSDHFSPITDEDEDTAIIETAIVARVGGHSSYIKEQQEPRILRRQSHTHPSRQSQLPYEESRSVQLTKTLQQHPSHESWEKPNPGNRVLEATMRLDLPMLKEYMPPPLSPRPPTSPAHSPDDTSKPGPNQVHHARKETAESTSWLNTIDESGGSSPSSVHSRTSSIGLRRKRIRAASGATEAEFDAALDAAVEAAYDEGFVPAVDSDEEPIHETSRSFVEPDFVSEVRRNVELAKERVREIEREAAITSAKNHEKRRLREKSEFRNRSDSIDTTYGGNEADEEERMLEEMTRDYIMDESEYDLHIKTALPRQSDSSSFSGRTWISSTGSNPTSAGTSLSTVAEGFVLPSLASQLQSKPHPPPSHPPPSIALPPPPLKAASTTTLPSILSKAKVASSNFSPALGPGVRERRLSGKDAKQLKIETNAKLPLGPESIAPKTQPLYMPPPILPPQAIPEPPKSAFAIADSQPAHPNPAFKQLTITTLAGSRQASSPLPGPISAELTASASPATPALSKTVSATSEDSVPPMPDSPARYANKASTGPGTLRKNFSSSSLRTRNFFNSTSDAPDVSPNAAPSTMSSTTSQHRKGLSTALSNLSTSTESSFIPSGPLTGGKYLFDTDIHSVTKPGMPNPLASNAPNPLEPCPDSFLLRPFWLLRCIYQTIAHPRGGYLSTRLFVPREVWRVKNVKLKGVEEKVSSCDLLTAALLKLARVDTLDADAVLEEMQSLESVLDQVQSNLSKKLGNEVGVPASSSLFKTSSAVEDAASASESLASKTSHIASKSYFSSWRKLRSKSSGTPGVPPMISTTTSKDGFMETLTMQSLPMSSANNLKASKRDINQVQCLGPNANYMGALARLCDAAQILDQVARQVEDPGLKHTSQTHVGLDLSTRHAAEFFGFYVCRFALNDVGMMVDKFVKRGSEWVLA